jgi:hypothetical protein
MVETGVEANGRNHVGNSWKKSLLRGYAINSEYIFQKVIPADEEDVIG